MQGTGRTSAVKRSWYHEALKAVKVKPPALPGDNYFIVLKILIRWFEGSLRLTAEGTDVIFRLIVDIDYMLKTADRADVLILAADYPPCAS